MGRAGVGTALRVPEFRRMVSAEVLSVAGDQVARVALALLVYSRTGSAALTALTYALTFVAIAAGWLLSGLADRFARRDVMVATDLVRAVLAAVMAVPGLPLGALWAAIVLLTLAGAPFKAAQQALLPVVLPSGQYKAGLSVRTMITQTAQLVGFGAGGALVAAVTPSGAMIINAATFVFSALLVRFGVRRRPAPLRPAVDDPVAAEPAAEARGALVAPFALVSIIGLFVVAEALAAPYAGQLGAGAAVVGLLMAADPAGAVVGAWLQERLPVRGGLNGALLPGVAAGLPLVACLTQPGVVGVALLWAATGALSTIYLIRAQAALVEQVPDHRRGKIMGRYTTCLYVSQGGAFAVAGLVADHAGPVWAVAGAGALGSLLVLLVGVMTSRDHHRRRMGRGDDDGVPTDRAESDQVSLDMSSSRAVGSSGGPATKPLEAGPPANGSAVSMTDTQRGRYGRSRRRTDGRGVRGWALWTRPRGAIALLLSVESAAVVIVVYGAIVQQWARTDLVLCGALIVLGVAAAEITRRVETMRRRTTAPATTHINVSSVWTFAGALVLPISLAALVAVVVYAHLWWRSWRRLSEVKPHRTVYNCANVVLCAAAVRLVVHAAPVSPVAAASPISLLWLFGALATFFVVNLLLAAASTVAYRPGERLTVLDLAGDVRENVLEAATLCMGVLVGMLLVLRPWAVVMVYVPLYVLHRSALIKQLEDLATIDSKTGLFNAPTWQTLVRREIDRAAKYDQTCGVLFLDLDRFKAVNDTYGHLPADDVLGEVGATITREIRGADLGGRFGGDEFMVLLADTSAADVQVVAERLRDQIGQLTVTDAEHGEQALSVSIGAACWPDHGDLEDVLRAADSALFAAKNRGPGQVVVVSGSIRRTATTAPREDPPSTAAPTQPPA